MVNALGLNIYTISHDTDFFDLTLQDASATVYTTTDTPASRRTTQANE